VAETYLLTTSGALDGFCDKSLVHLGILPCNRATTDLILMDYADWITVDLPILQLLRTSRDEHFPLLTQRKPI
jgi:hypothetical protein